MSSLILRDESLIALMVPHLLACSVLVVALASSCGEAAKKGHSVDALGNDHDDAGSGADGDDDDVDLTEIDPSLGDSESDKPAPCAKAEGKAKRVIPTVWLFVEGSGLVSFGLFVYDGGVSSQLRCGAAIVLL